MVDTPQKMQLMEQLHNHHPFPHKIVEWTLRVGNHYREEQNLTPCLKKFFFQIRSFILTFASC